MLQKNSFEKQCDAHLNYSVENSAQYSRFVKFNKAEQQKRVLLFWKTTLIVLMHQFNLGSSIQVWELEKGWTEGRPESIPAW